VNRITVAIAASALAVGISGIAFASSPNAGNSIHWCKGKNGAVRIAKTCKSGESNVTWNKQGPAGPQGSHGPKGDTGATGAQGSAGSQGAAGLQGPAGLTGATGPAGPQGSQGSQGPKGDPGSGANSWSLTGNAGTSPSTNFLGTTDNQALVVKTNNNEALRIDTGGNVSIGLTSSGARLDVLAPSGGTAVQGTGTSTGRGVVGRLGNVSCQGAYAVGGCAGDANSIGVFGTSSIRIGVEGDSTSGTGVSGAASTGIGVLGFSDYRAVEGDTSNGIGVIGTSNTRGVVGTLGIISCAGVYAVGGCGGTLGDGVQGVSTNGTGVDGISSGGHGTVGISNTGIGVYGNSNVEGIVGTLQASSCPYTSAIAACAGPAGDGLVVEASSGISDTAILAINDSPGSGTGTCCDIFLGYSGGTREARISGEGRGYFASGTQTGGQDYAESMRAIDSSRLEPGDVLAIDPQHGNAVRLSRGRSSPLVVGVYSTKPSVLAVGTHHIGDSLKGEVPVALMGVVPTKVTAENGPIRAGDLLTTSSKPGYAMKAPRVLVGGIAIYPTGTILGKALAPLRSGSGVIQVLLMTR
jgi:hypothetical protein